MSHCYHPKGQSCGCLSNESSKVSFSHAHLAHVGHKALANLFFIARIFRSRIGDSRRRAATVGDSRRQSASECTRAEEVQKKCTSRLPYRNDDGYWTVSVMVTLDLIGVGDADGIGDGML